MKAKRKQDVVEIIIVLLIDPEKSFTTDQSVEIFSPLSICFTLSRRFVVMLRRLGSLRKHDVDGSENVI